MLSYKICKWSIAKFEAISFTNFVLLPNTLIDFCSDVLYAYLV